MFTKSGNEFTSRTQDQIDGNLKTRDLLGGILESLGTKWDVHLPTFLTAPSLARIFWLNHVYQEAIHVPGVLVEFGSQWGASLNVFLLCKLIYEPWNASRRILSFSLFEEGFTDVNQQDGSISKKGDYSVNEGWKSKLDQILGVHAACGPLNPKMNFQIHPGDATVTFAEYLKNNPETIISHAHFDMDLYRPTKAILELCIDRMPRGAVLVFDELNCPSFPGETVAINEVLGLRNLKLKKTPFQPYSVYTVIGD
jgi:hypothetical protein